jgi:uncharacterized membrane protein YheB (UPF0754 family)
MKEKNHSNITLSLETEVRDFIMENIKNYSGRINDLIKRYLISDTSIEELRNELQQQEEIVKELNANLQRKLQQEEDKRSLEEKKKTEESKQKELTELEKFKISRLRFEPLLLEHFTPDQIKEKELFELIKEMRNDQRAFGYNISRLIKEIKEDLIKNG